MTPKQELSLLNFIHSKDIEIISETEFWIGKTCFLLFIKTDSFKNESYSLEQGDNTFPILLDFYKILTRHLTFIKEEKENNHLNNNLENLLKNINKN